MVARPLEFLSTFLLRARLLSVCRERQNSFPTIRERKPHLEQRRGKEGSSRVVLGPSVFLSSGDGCVGELHELQHGCEGPFDVQEGRRDWSGCRSRKQPHIACRGEPPDNSGVAAGHS